MTKVVVACLFLTASLAAQLPDPSAMAANPVSTSARMFLAQQAEAISGAANLMPANRYGYHPTPAQMTFGALMAHIVESNVRICSAIGGAPVEPPDRPPATAPKATLVGAVQYSFTTCETAFAKINDAQMADMVDIAGSKAPRAFLVMTIVADWADHYSTAASYLRLNGIRPPTARRQTRQRVQRTTRLSTASSARRR
jgi:hypothetical protein